MADSKTTKRALANALKDVMTEKPFEKISVSDICNRCNRNRKALQINGQNSFLDHFREWLLYISDKTLPDIVGEEKISDFQRNFIADTFGITFIRWVLEYPAIPPEEFMEQLKICIKYMAVGYEKLD